MTLLPAGAARDALASATTAEQLADGPRQFIGDLAPAAARAAGYAGDTARHVLGARSAPGHRARPRGGQRLHRRPCGRFAEDALDAVKRERDWQAQWLARRLGVA